MTLSSSSEHTTIAQCVRVAEDRSRWKEIATQVMVENDQTRSAEKIEEEPDSLYEILNNHTPARTNSTTPSHTSLPPLRDMTSSSFSAT